MSLDHKASPLGSLGSVIAIRGSKASVGLLVKPAQSTEEPSRVTVGKFFGIYTGTPLLIGMVTDVSLQSGANCGDQDHLSVATLDIIGEIQNYTSSSAYFRRGVTDYPAIGDSVTLVGPRELHLIFNISGPTVMEIGHLQQDSEIGAYVDADEMLSKHFAVLGTTGVGKSSAVALIIQQTLVVRPDLRVLVLDVHNEYRPCFRDRALPLSPRNMKLPFGCLISKKSSTSFLESAQASTKRLISLISWRRSFPSPRQTIPRLA